MPVAIVGDTHIPSRATAIPTRFRERMRAADHVPHTGDFDSEAAFANQRALSPDLTAVTGNMDPALDLPAVATVDLNGLTVVLTHGTGSPASWHDRVASLVAGEGAPPRVGVAGHTHEVVDTVHDGVRLLNPGSATGAAPADRPTMMTAEPRGEDIAVTIHEL